MPIWLRRFTFNKLDEYYKKQNESVEKQQNTLGNKDILRPDVNQSPPPTYTTKAPKK